VGGPVAVGGRGNEVVPLLDEELEVAVDVGLELDDGLGGEGVRDDLPLAGVVRPVARVEDAALDADEGVVEGAVACRQWWLLCFVGLDTYDFSMPLPWPRMA